MNSLQTSLSLQNALDFLSLQQGNSEHCFAGAFACMLYGDDIPGSQEIGQVDWTVFNTALVIPLLRELTVENESKTPLPLPDFRTRLAEMMTRAEGFLQKAALDNPEGSYGFWPPTARSKAAADLDDTALAYFALSGGSPDNKLPNGENCQEIVWRLFAPYRITAGTPLAKGSRWAAAFPGVFQTWMSTNRGETHAVVDATVIVHICRLLLSLGLTDFPGLLPSLRLLNEGLSDGPTATIPVEQFSPYYRSKTRFWSACSKIPPVIPEAVQVRETLCAVLQQQPFDADLSFEDRLWLATASKECGLLKVEDLNALVALQQLDGGWPPIPLCNDLLGRWHWTSRVLSTLLVLNLLDPDFSSLTTSASNTAKELAHPC